MRELFLSCAVCAARRGGVSELRKLLSVDLRKTGLYPLFPLPRAPAVMNLTALKARSRQRGLFRTTGRMSPETCAAFVGVISHRGTAYVCDPTRDAIYCLPFDPAEPADVDHDRAVYRLTDAQLKRQLEELVRTEADGRGDWRPPTIEDFDSLVYVNALSTVLLRGEAYWTADVAEDGTRLCVVVGAEGAYSPDFTLVALRKIDDRGREDLSYRVLKPNRQRMDRAVVRAPRALLVRTSIGDADGFRHFLMK